MTIDHNEAKTAVILAGGLGSRLHPYTLTIPKPLLPLGGTPIIEIVVSQLANQGFSRVIVTLGYMGDMIKFTLGDGDRFGLIIEYVTEKEPLGTAGSLYLIDELPSEFLVMNGDLLTTFPYSKLLSSLDEREVAAAIASHKRTVNIDYGVLERDIRGNLATYNEKPKLDYLVSMGIYALKLSAIENLNGSRLDMPDLLDSISKENRGVYIYESDDYWQDIGRLDDFETAGKDFESDRQRFLESK
jgi:NDP-sugar pyrophosphorylase family protein